MLVLTRRSGESIILQDQTHPDRPPIRFTVLEQMPSRVRIGVDAANDILILRSELTNKPYAEKPA